MYIYSGESQNIYIHVDKVVFLSPADAAAANSREYTESDKGNEAVENCHADRPTWLTLEFIVVPVHPIIAETFPPDAGEVSPEPGPTDTEVQLVVLTVEIPVHPVTVSCSPGS